MNLFTFLKIFKFLIKNKVKMEILLSFKEFLIIDK